MRTQYLLEMFAMGPVLITQTICPCVPRGKRPLRRDPMPDHLKVFAAIAARAQQAMSELIELARLDTPSSRKRRG
jgi:hypothetical protein